MEHVDLTTAASVSAAHVVSAVCPSWCSSDCSSCCRCTAQGWGLQAPSCLPGDRNWGQSNLCVTLSILLGSHLPLCLESTSWCHCHLVPRTVKREMQDWLTWAASTPVKCLVESLIWKCLHPSLVFQVEAISFSLSKHHIRFPFL